MQKLSAFKVSVPGSTMIMGEHAVLAGQPALVCALDTRIDIRVVPRDDRVIQIESELGKYQASLDHLPHDAALSFVVAAIQAYQTRLERGFELSIHSDFSSTIGLGSSAAVTAAMVKLLNYLTGQPANLYEEFQQGLAIIHQVQQGRGSGADLAASLAGGLVLFCHQPEQSIPIRIDSVSCPESIVFSLYYCGYKMKTPEVLRHVETLWRAQPELLQDLYQLMGSTTSASITALENNDLKTLGRLMNIYQGLMDALGVCDKTLAAMVYQLRGADQIMGAKISGSGLGDCVLTLGTETSPLLPKYPCLSVRPAQWGAQLHVRSSD